MSACNGFATPTASYLFTDAAVVDPKTFNVLAFMNKVSHLPQCGAAVSATGNLMVLPLFAATLAESNVAGFDNLISMCPEIVRKATRKAAALGAANIFEGFRIAIAGWSPKANAPALYCVQGDDGIGARAFETVSCAKFINPCATHAADQSILRLSFDPAQPAESGLMIMRAQREKKFSAYYGIGGWCEMTTVTRDAITTRILKYWPQDKIGRPISPSDVCLAKRTVV